jgi:hypothetical protein
VLVAAICVVSSSVAADEVLALAVLAGQSRDGSSASTPKSRVQRHLRLPANWDKKWVSLFPFVPLCSPAALGDDDRLSEWILNRPGSYFYRRSTVPHELAAAVSQSAGHELASAA